MRAMGRRAFVENFCGIRLVALVCSNDLTAVLGHCRQVIECVGDL